MIIVRQTHVHRSCKVWSQSHATLSRIMYDFLRSARLTSSLLDILKQKLMPFRRIELRLAEPQTITCGINRIKQEELQGAGVICDISI